MIRLMIVDDDLNYRYAIKNMINWEKYGMEIACEALHGKQAIKLLEKEKKVDVIITDMSMPLMNGVELVKWVKEKYSDIIIIALSAYDEFEFVKESLLHGAFDYILKQDMNEKTFEKLAQRLLEEIEKKTERNSFENLFKKYMTDENYEINIIMKYIIKNYNKELNLSNIAQAVGYSENYLSNHFKLETKMNLMQFINIVRIEKSKLLLETPLKVYEIAHRVGYNNSSYFSTVFKKVTGESVKDYRKKRSDM